MVGREGEVVLIVRVEELFNLCRRSVRKSLSTGIQMSKFASWLYGRVNMFAFILAYVRRIPRSAGKNAHILDVSSSYQVFWKASWVSARTKKMLFLRMS